MNRILHSVIVLLLVVLECGAQHPAMRARTPTVTASGGAAPTYLASEDFEGTGLPSGWAETGAGTENYDDTTAPSPLQGAQSLRCSTTAQNSRVETPNWTAIAEIHGYFIMNPINTVAAGNTRKIVTFENQGGGGTEGLSLVNGEEMTISQGAASASTVATISDGVTIHVWFRWKARTGPNDGIGEVWWSTTATKPADGSNNHATTGATGSSSATGMRSIAVGCAPDDGSVTWTIIYDKVRVDDVAIGSNPT